MEDKDMTYQAQRVNITVRAYDALVEPGETYEVEAALLPDGRLFVTGAGTDGRDALFASVNDYEPNGNDREAAMVITNATVEVPVSDVVAADYDNVAFGGESLLTPDEELEVETDRMADEAEAATQRWAESFESGDDAEAA